MKQPIDGEGDYGKKGIWVRVGSEVERGQVDLTVCLRSAQLERHRCVYDRQGSYMINLSRQMEV